MKKAMNNYIEIMKYGVLGRKFPKYRKVCDGVYTFLGIATTIYLGCVAGKAIVDYFEKEAKKKASC